MDNNNLFDKDNLNQSQNQNQNSDQGQFQQPYQQQTTYQQPNQQQTTYQQSTYQQPYQTADSELEEPVSFADWMLTSLIMIIPCVNIIMLCVWAFGSGTKKSKSNYCKAMLVWMLIGVVLSFVLGSVFAALFASLIQEGVYY